jgi:hypothetical protein
MRARVGAQTALAVLLASSGCGERPPPVVAVAPVDASVAITDASVPSSSPADAGLERHVDLTPPLATAPDIFPETLPSYLGNWSDGPAGYVVERHPQNGWWSLAMFAREVDGDDNSHRFHGWVVTETDIEDVRYSSDQSPNERYVRESRRLHFDFRSRRKGRFADTLQFKPRPGGCVTFALWLDGEPASQHVRFGKDLRVVRSPHVRFCPERRQ